MADRSWTEYYRTLEEAIQAIPPLWPNGARVRQPLAEAGSCIVIVSWAGVISTILSLTCTDAASGPVHITYWRWAVEPRLGELQVDVLDNLVCT